MTLEKRGEIKSFTDQVRIICVKNSIDKPSLGEKIGLDNKTVFTAIKNNAFKPDPKVYFKLETYICGKDSHYKNKLRSKYEKTLDVTEWSEYVKESANMIKPKTIKFSAPKNAVEEEDKKEMMTLIIDKPNTKANASKTDKEAKVQFYKLLTKGKAPNVSIREIDSKILGHQTIANMHSGYGFVPTDKLEDVLKMAQIEEGSEAWQELVELQLSCIAGPKEDEELPKYEKIFGSLNAEVKSEKEEIEEEVEVATVNEERTMKEFSDILTKWLFMKGYTLKQTARAIGCSEQELKSVINGDICLSPYHVNRFKDTIGMDTDTINTLVKIANEHYKGHEIPQSILDYISSDTTIISTLEEIVRQNKSAQFWDEIWKKL